MIIEKGRLKRLKKIQETIMKKEERRVRMALN